MKIVYVGTFNPITLGHIKIMEYVLDEFKNSSILVVPSSDLYAKETLKTSFDDRFHMIKLAIKNHNNIDASDVEKRLSIILLRNPKTIETLYEFNEEVMLLIGSDNYLALDSWYHIEDLLKNFKVIVYPRSKFNKEDVKLYKKYKERFIFLDDAELYEISSSEIREKLKNNEDTKSILNEEVLNYIKEHNLYKE